MHNTLKHRDIRNLHAGISYYRFISDLYDNFEERKEIISSKLNKITERIFTVDRLIVSLTGDDTVYTAVRDSLAGFIDGLPDVAYDTAERNFRYTNIRRAYKSASQVNYVARCGSFGDKGIEYSPALKVFKTIMDYDYLWINIRVKGGAYGCMNGYNVTGNGYSARTGIRILNRPTSYTREYQNISETSMQRSVR